MRAIKLSIMALAISAACVTSYAQTADEVIQKHIDAMGGTKNWDKIKTIKLVGGMSTQGFEIGMTQTIVNGKAMRIDISAMGQNGYIIVTPTAGWQFMPFAGQTKPQEIPADQLKSQKSQINYKNGMLVDKAEITKATLDGTDTISSVPCYKIKVTKKDGDEEVCYFDSKTYYMVRMEKKMKIQEEEQEVAINYSNFAKQASGITIPMVVGSPQGDITYKTVDINKPVDEKIFKPEPAK